MNKAAVIGLGFVGAGDQVSGDALGQKVVNLDGFHAQALAGNPEVQLVAGSSRDAGKRSRFAERFSGVRTYADWREMLSAEKPEIVSVATNSPVHAEISIGCAEAGARAVLCEKPVATRLSDADRMIEACRRKRTLLVVNHNRRWHPLWNAVRDEVRQDVLGEIRHVVAHWPTGRLGNVGTHILDAVRFLLGQEAQAVSGAIDPVLFADCRGAQYRDPGGWGVVIFRHGTRLFVEAAQGSKTPLEVRLVGDLGQINIRGAEAVLELWKGDKRVIAPHKDGRSSMDRAVADIVACLKSGGSPASTGEDGRAALEIIIGFHASHRLRGQWVPLPIEGADRDMEVLIG